MSNLGNSEEAILIYKSRLSQIITPSNKQCHHRTVIRITVRIECQFFGLIFQTIALQRQVHIQLLLK